MKDLELPTVGSSQRLQGLRREAIKRFEQLPWPSKTDEEWRRTNPEEIPYAEVELKDKETSLRVGWETPPPEMIRSGVILTDLKTAFKQFPQLLEEYLFRSGSPEGLSKFVALHEALWNDGLFLYIPDGTKITSPLKAWAEITSSGVALFPHILVVVGKGAEVTLIDERHSSGNGRGPVVLNEMVELFLKSAATLRYIRLQRCGPSVVELFTQRALLENQAQLNHVAVGWGGRLTKANIETVLQGDGGRSELLGILFGSDHQHFDFHTLQDHKARATFSDLLYKSALKDQSRSIYTGLIRIRKEAQKSDAYQANRNLLLDQGAKADSIPMLEIEADDVRCTHGVAVGPVDREQAFYLMSRGLTEPEANRLIVQGFFEQVFQRIPLGGLREELLEEVDARLKALSKPV